MIFTAYFDEADTHGPTPTMIMAAFLAHSYQWDRFGNRLARLQKRYGFKVFHGSDFKAKSGEFAGWSDAKCMSLVSDLTALVRDELTEGLVVHLEHERFTREYRAPPIPKKMNLDSQYGVCFRACMRHLLNILPEGQHRLNLVMEDGHPNVGNAVAIFKELRQVLRRQGNDVLGTIEVTTKQKASPCMMADFLAGTYSMMRASANAGGLDYKKETPEPAQGEAGLSFLELLPDALRSLKEDFQRNRERAAAEWRARGAARRSRLSHK